MVEFGEELERVLPSDLPHRERVLEKCARHLELVIAANQYMNLTRIVSPQEAAIKHVFDSIAPWVQFCGSESILDAGTGAGFPGIPLSLVLPDARFVLSESIGKKASFLESAVETLELANIQVTSERAEAITAGRRVDTITARAVAPVARLLELFQKPLKEGIRLLLYKGSDVEAELEEVRRHRLSAKVLCRYELPDSLGSRSILEIRANSAVIGSPRTRGEANRR